ncbi:MAG: hypothetical protein KGI29_06285 [Pseudomonadota bacterium]|nr:hypothetical protein [Pseudomonadota bacterium]MDE3037751.1 hypothetical protein [Pseudomonadota bacterium]
MFPIALDLTRIPVLLVGQGELLQRRLAQLQEAGVTEVTVLEGASPTAGDLQQCAIVMVAGLPREQAERIVIAAHEVGKLVNVEDINDLCNFYFTANVRRGDLIIAVSTSGASPTLARKIRDAIAATFGEEWRERLREIAELRQIWKKQGKVMKEVVDATEKHVKEKGWLTQKREVV